MNEITTILTLILAFGIAFALFPMITLFIQLIEKTIKWLKENVTPTLHIHEWENVTKEMSIKDRKIPLRTRYCKKCGQKQYRTKMPMQNGIDRNVWRNYYKIIKNIK